MSPHLQRLRLAIYLLSASLIGLALIGGVIGYSPVPYWDMWGGTLGFVQRFEEDPFRLLFSQHNEHRIVLSRLLFLVDYHLFGGASVFLVLCNYLLAAAIWAVFACCIFSLNRSKDVLDRWIMVAILGAWLFLWAQKVNFTWAFQSQFFLAQLIPLLAFLSLCQAAFRTRVWRRWYTGALILGALSPLTMANGLFVFPLMVFGAIMLRMTRVQIGVLIICAVVAISLYMGDYQSPSAHGSLLDTPWTSPLSVLHYTFSYLGNPGVYIAGSFSVIRLLSAFAGVCLAAIAFILTTQAVLTRPTQPVSFGLLLFIIFVGAGAFATAAGRMPFGIESAFSSRYTTPVLMAWAALFCMASPRLLHFHQSHSNRRYMTLGAAVLALSILMVSQFRALTPVHQFNHQKMVAALALELGIGDDDFISLIHPNPDQVLAIAHAASQNDLGIFGAPPLRGAREIIGQSATSSTLRSCAGGLENYENIDNAPGYVRVYGWQFTSKNNRQSARMHIVSIDGQIVGIVIPGRASPDLVLAYGAAAARSGFTGYLISDAVGKDLNITSSVCQFRGRL